MLVTPLTWGTIRPTTTQGSGIQGSRMGAVPRSMPAALRFVAGILLVIGGVRFALWAAGNMLLAGNEGEWSGFDSTMGVLALGVIAIPTLLLAFGLFLGGAKCGIASGVVCLLFVVAALGIFRDARDPYWYVVLFTYAFAAVGSLATIYVRDKPAAVGTA